MNGKMILLLCFAGLVAAAGVIGSAPSSDGTVVAAIKALSLRDATLAFTAFAGPTLSYYLPDLVIKVPSVAGRLIVLGALCGSLTGCAPTVTAHAGIDQNGTVSGTVDLTIKDQIAQAIKCEKQAIEDLKASYNAMRRDQEKTHRAVLKAHTDRLNKLQAGVWSEPVAIAGEQFIPPIADAHASTPITLPPYTMLPAPGDTNTPATGPPETPAPTVTRLAVLIGINDYPGAQLNGCVNDVLNIKKLLIDNYGFKESEIVLILNGEATTARFLKALEQLSTNVKPGDLRLLWYSGHGALYPQMEANGTEKIVQVLCPVDFDWTEPRMIQDAQVRAQFAKFCAGAKANCGLDACHTGDKNIVLNAAATAGTAAASVRSFPGMPKAILDRVNAAKLKASPREFAFGEFNVGVVCGCGKKQTSADTVNATGAACGAMTDAFITVVKKPGNSDKPLNDIVDQMSQLLQSQGYDQKPEVLRTIRADKPFLKSENELNTEHLLRLPVWNWRPLYCAEAA